MLHATEYRRPDVITAFQPRRTPNAAGNERRPFIDSGLDEALLVQIGEQPAMRQYDLANRNRNQFSGIVDLVPNDVWTFSVSGGVGKDNYPDSYIRGILNTVKTIAMVGVSAKDSRPAYCTWPRSTT